MVAHLRRSDNKKGGKEPSGNESPKKKINKKFAFAEGLIAGVMVVTAAVGISGCSDKYRAMDPKDATADRVDVNDPKDADPDVEPLDARIDVNVPDAEVDSSVDAEVDAGPYVCQEPDCTQPTQVINQFVEIPVGETVEIGGIEIRHVRRLNELPYQAEAALECSCTVDSTMVLKSQVILDQNIEHIENLPDYPVPGQNWRVKITPGIGSENSLPASVTVEQY